MARIHIKGVLVALALIVIGWMLGKAQTRQPDFEFVISAPGGQTSVECLRGCELMWAERGPNANSQPATVFSFGCGGERCTSGRIGGWITR